MEEFLYAILGFLFGLFAKFVYDWNLDRRERRTIRKSLILEILYMHEPTLRLLLDRYSEPYEKGRFQAALLGASFRRPPFPITIYESHVTKIDRLIGSDVCLQLHYYYSLIQDLNERSAQPNAEVNEDFAKSYLAAVARAYVMGNGAVEAILGNPEALKAMRDNLRSLLASFDDVTTREYVAGVLRSYGLRGSAESIRRPTKKRSNELLRNHWF